MFEHSQTFINTRISRERVKISFLFPLYINYSFIRHILIKLKTLFEFPSLHINKVIFLINIAHEYILFVIILNIIIKIVMVKSYI